MRRARRQLREFPGASRLISTQRSSLSATKSSVEDDEAQSLLADVIEGWWVDGPLDVLLPLLGQVWRANVDRHEPVLGDDAMTLGIQSSRNLLNLAVPLLSELPGTTARDVKTLEVAYGGRVLHTSKAPSSSPSWDVHSMDWTSSEVRYDGAAANMLAYMPTAGTLLEGHEPLSGQPTDPRALRHLHLTWQGLPDGGTCAWFGFPRMGYPAWFAVARLDSGEGGTGGLPQSPLGTVPPTPDFDALGEPDVPVVRRSQPRRA